MGQGRDLRGNTQQVVDVEVDCDGDAVLLQVRPAGPACHTGLHVVLRHRLPARVRDLRRALVTQAPDLATFRELARTAA